MDKVKETAPASGNTSKPSAEALASRDPWGRVRELALRQLHRFMSYEPKVLRGDDPSAIHDIRVASRRLQQLLNLLYPPPRPKEVQRLRRQLRRSRRALGEVRNCDALVERIENLLAKKRTPRREAWRAVKEYLLERRAERFQKVLGKLSKLNLAVFYVHLRQSLDSHQPASFSHSPRALTHPPRPPLTSFPQRIAQTLERAWTAFEDQVIRSHREPDPRVIHSVRIATKRLRYLIEVVDEFEVPGSADTLAWLRQLQLDLGHWHDLQVLEQMIIEMVARPEFLREHLPVAMSVARLIPANRRTLKGYEERYFRLTRDSADFTRVKEWTAYLLEFPSAVFTKVGASTLAS